MKTINANFGKSRLSRDEMRSIDGGLDQIAVEGGGQCSGDKCNWNSECADGCTCRPSSHPKEAGYCKV